MTDVDLTQLYDHSKSLAEGAITIPCYTVDGWMVQSFTASGFLDPDKPIREYTETELHDFLHREATRSRSRASTRPTRCCSPGSRSNCSPRAGRLGGAGFAR